MKLVPRCVKCRQEERPPMRLVSPLGYMHHTCAAQHEAEQRNRRAREMNPARRAQTFSPVVVFKEKDGSYRYPGRSDERTPRGCERVELRTTREVRAFEKTVNGRERAAMERKLELQQGYLDADRSARRSALRQQMQTMSPWGRDFARLAMERNDARRRSLSETAARFDPKFRVVAFE